MNIFWLDNWDDKCAQAHVDKHVVKMPLELAQLLQTTLALHGMPHVYKPTHENHPCRLWIEESSCNYFSTLSLGLALCKEYTYRYGRQHKSQVVLEESISCPETIMHTECGTSLPICVPDDCLDVTSAVQSYRNYYIKYKSHLFSWTKREPPSWIPAELLQKTN